MKKKTAFACCLLMLIFNFHVVQAQTDSSSKAKAEFKISINYNSNLNYYGRTDSLNSTGVFPLAELWLNQKFYVNAAPIFVNNAVQSYDYVGTVATIGYQNVTSKWITAASVLTPFYNQSSTLLQSALKAQANLSATSLNKIANITLGVDAKFSDKTDFGATAGIDHSFLVQGKKSTWVIDPSFFAFAGTRQFSRTYAKKQSSFLDRFRGSEEETLTYKNFSLLAYEASLPIVWVRNKIMLMATPAYVLPQNLINDPAKPELSEQGENTFYTTISIKYSF